VPNTPTAKPRRQRSTAASSVKGGRKAVRCD
jgi:hypothetical protein